MRKSGTEELNLVFLRAANMQESVLSLVKVILQFQADPRNSLNNQQPKNLVVLPDPTGAPIQIPFQGTLQPTVVLILSNKTKKTSKKTQLQRLANPKTKSNIPTSSPFTQFPTPIKGGAKQKKKES